MQKNERIEIERDYDQVEWSLPNRDLSEHSQYGWFVLAFAAVVLLFTTAWIAGPLYLGVEMISRGEWFGVLLIGFAMVGLGGLNLAVRFLVLGYLITRNRTRSTVKIVKGKLFSIEKLGWFDWRRRIKVEDIRELRIKDSSRMGKEQGGHMPGAWKVLEATTEKKKFLVVMGYSDEIINQLAEQLSKEIGKEVGFSRAREHESKAERMRSENSIPIRTEHDIESIPEQPSDSKIVVHDQGEQLAYEIPAQGFKSGAGGLLAFACLWLTFCSVFLVVALAQGIEGDFTTGMIILSVFFLVGIAMLIFSIYLARQSMMIGVLGDQLFIEKKSIFGEKWIEYAVADIRRIYVGDSNVEVNDEPIRELKIQAGEDRPKGVLSRLDDQELEWLAFHLSQAIGIARSDDEEEVTWQSEVAKLGDLQLPKKSPIRMDEKVDGVRIRVPWRLTSLIVPVFIGIFAMAAGVFIGSPLGAGGVVGILFGVVFGSVGIFTTLISLEFCTRRFVFEVDGKTLNARRSSLFAKKTIQWHRDEIQSIDVGFSGMKTNGKKCYQLQIRSEKENFSGMTSWSIPELAVVAGTLNQALDR